MSNVATPRRSPSDPHLLARLRPLGPAVHASIPLPEFGLSAAPNEVQPLPEPWEPVPEPPLSLPRRAWQWLYWNRWWLPLTVGSAVVGWVVERILDLI